MKGFRTVLKSIQTDEDHLSALARLDELWESEKGTADFTELVALTALIEAYEDMRWPFPTA